MKRWPIVIAFLYVVTLMAVIVPGLYVVFVFHNNEKINLGELFGSWSCWAWILILMLDQWALLSLPVDVTNKRPASKRAIVFQISASAFMMALLIAGLAVGLGELVKGGGSFNYINWMFYGALGVSWLFWAWLFKTWNRKLKPENLIKRTCRTLFSGSVLQLLVVVPCHVVARNREYCCAGYATAIGLACGLAVMLASFGPGIFFLYANHWRKIHPSANGTGSSPEAA